jgi:hypothetical protein
MAHLGGAALTVTFDSRIAHELQNAYGCFSPQEEALGLVPGTGRWQQPDERAQRTNRLCRCVPTTTCPPLASILNASAMASTMVDLPVPFSPTGR